MQKIAKRQLFSKKITTITLVLAYVLLPVLYVTLICPYNLFFFFISYLVILSTVIFLYRKIGQTFAAWEIRKSSAYERLNMLQAELDQAARLENVYQKKKRRYVELESMMQKLSYNLSLEAVAHYIVQKTLDMIPKADQCVIYIVDEKRQRLELVDVAGDVEVNKVQPFGDVFDRWILKHACPLLIEDTSQDYRFDLETIDERIIVGSVLSVPLILDEKLVGVLRLNSFEKYTFYSEDLYFLQTIGDLSAVAIGNTILYRRMEELALHDGLTGLYLRRYVLEKLDEIILYRKQKHFCLIMLDIDDFKKYNDNYGHTAGDIVIRSVAKILLKHTRRHKDIVSRYGGEEFLVYLEGKDRQAGVLIAEKIREEISQKEIVLRRTPTSVTVSIGVSVYPQDGKDKIQLIKKADERLYLAKSTGKNRVCFA